MQDYLLDTNMKNPYHYYLNLPIKFNPNPVDMEGGHHRLYPLERVEKDFADWFIERGVRIGFGEQFELSLDGVRKHIIHTDDFDKQPIVKLNYVYCETPHLMHWYKLKPGIETTTAYSPAGTPYSTCTSDECDLVYSAQVGKPSLVNVMELHNVSEVSSTRICYSFVLVHSNRRVRLNWEEATELLKDYIIEL